MSDSVFLKASKLTDLKTSVILSKIPCEIAKNTEEIRMRLNQPLSLTVSGKTLFINNTGQTVSYPDENTVTVSEGEINETFKKLCKSSVYARFEELKNGYLKLSGGCRAGIFGTLSKDGNMTDITGINIRIAKEVKKCALPCAEKYRGEGILITGPPGSGKTTFLRDFIRCISSGYSGDIYRVAVIDSRGEISGDLSLDLGYAADVLYTEDKAKGVEIALRTMFPQVIAFDEIGTADELQRISECFNSGVSVITTAHISSPEILLKRKITENLIRSGIIDRIIFLSGNRNTAPTVFCAGDLL